MHTENNTAPPPTQLPDIQDDDGRGFIYFTVMVKTSKIVLQGLPLMDRQLAYTLAEMLLPEFPEKAIYIQPCGASAHEHAQIEVAAGRHKDVITSCQTAVFPGREYLARLGASAMYDPRLDPMEVLA